MPQEQQQSFLADEANAADPDCWDNCFGGSVCEETCQREWNQEYDDCQAEVCADEYAACIAG